MTEVFLPTYRSKTAPILSFRKNAGCELIYYRNKSEDSVRSCVRFYFLNNGGGGYGEPKT